MCDEKQADYNNFIYHYYNYIIIITIINVIFISVLLPYFRRHNCRRYTGSMPKIVTSLSNLRRRPGWIRNFFFVCRSRVTPAEKVSEPSPGTFHWYETQELMLCELLQSCKCNCATWDANKLFLILYNMFTFFLRPHKRNLKSRLRGW